MFLIYEIFHSHVAGDITCRKIYTDDVSDVQGVIIAESGSVCCRVGGEITITGTPPCKML